MTDATALQTEIYKIVKAERFTRCPGTPTWPQWENFIEEARDIFLDIDVTYDWSGEYGISAELAEPVEYFG